MDENARKDVEAYFYRTFYIRKPPYNKLIKQSQLSSPNEKWNSIQLLEALSRLATRTHCPHASAASYLDVLANDSIKAISMGLTKDYLRYVHSGSCGCVGSSNGEICAVDEKVCAVTACENVSFYNMRTTEKVRFCVILFTLIKLSFLFY
ncbi:hypothetical protein OESDEN_07666 [Oesophagostomum dentatum]|uniref:Uncharacterized protein n=1 Tax=Oesophagostomum dentatum TaxID=61180 RepID=A0A0B1T8F9_OESDE|nr:hypothetical protein OESDEN_07666 [Oesophagostomum dentatum]